MIFFLSSYVNPSFGNFNARFKISGNFAKNAYNKGEAFLSPKLLNCISFPSKQLKLLNPLISFKVNSNISLSQFKPYFTEFFYYSLLLHVLINIIKIYVSISTVLEAGSLIIYERNSFKQFAARVDTSLLESDTNSNNY